MSSTIVVDLGSNAVKCGLAHTYLTDTQPAVVTSSRLSSAAEPPGGQQSLGSIEVIREGQIADWAGLERILYDAVYMQLGWEKGEEGHLLIAEPLCTSREDREQLAQLAFEVFNVTGLFFADQALLSLFSVGKSTGLVVDLGHTKTDVSVVVDGLLYLPSVRRLPFGGRDITHHLQQRLAARGITIDEPDVVQGLKEACATAEDSSDKAVEDARPPFKLPDGRLVSISHEEAAEVASCLLQPALMGIDCPSVVETAAASIFSHLDPAVRKAALDSVFVCGGGSAVPGIAQKMCRELRQLLPPSMTPVATSVPEYMPATTAQHASWMGGAVLSKILMQHNHYVTKADYEENGPAIVHRKMGL